MKAKDGILIDLSRSHNVVVAVRSGSKDRNILALHPDSGLTLSFQT